VPPTSTMKRSTRRLSEVARHVVVPSGIVSTGWPAVEARIQEFGDSFDEWQQGASKLILAKRANGDYAATVGGITLSIPRQVAKTYMISRIIFALCTLFPNLTVLWTAHRTRTATKTFASLRGFAGRKSVEPYVRAVRAVNGEQEIHFTNGSVIMFGAREGGFGRGFDEIDVEVFDEAQILTEKALEDMIAATNQSRFPAGALLFFMGTPPRPSDPSEAFKLRRREALTGETEDAVYIECSADEDAEPDDREQWAIANPSYPHRTPLRSMLRLRKNLPSDESWKREALGIWDSDQQGSRLITADAWDATGVESAPADGVRSFGVAFSFDGKRVAVAGAAKHAGGIYIELADAQTGHMDAGIASLADWLAQRRQRTALIGISGRAGAEALQAALIERGVAKRAVHVLSTPEYFASNSMLHDAVKDKTVTHLATEGQAVLDQSVSVCDKKMRGASGAWGWTATVPGGDETPVEAASVAHWAARTTKRVPGRKQELI
jgi:hypothetical protein